MGRRRRLKHRHLPPGMLLINGRYYFKGYDRETGKRPTHPLGRDFSKAILRYAEFTGTDIGGNSEPGRTFVDLALRFEQLEFGKLRDSTRAQYARSIAKLVATFGAAPLGEIKPVHIAQYCDERSSIHGANYERAVMSAVFKKGIRWGWCDDNPAAKVEAFPTKARERYLTDEEFNHLRESANNPLIPVIMDLAYLTGLRIGDILRLKWANTQSGCLSVHQSKNNVRVDYSLTPALEQVLARARALRSRKVTSVFIFATRTGSPYTYYGFRAIFRRAVKKAELEDVRFHDIRGKAITDAQRQGRRAQDFSRHKTESQAANYVKARSVPTVLPLDPCWNGPETRSREGVNSA